LARRSAGAGKATACDLELPFRLPVMPADRLIGGAHGTGHIRAAFEYPAAARGVVFALSHMGNHDLAGAWVIAEGAESVTTVAERAKPESVYGRFVAFREGLGVEVLPASGGTSSAFGVLAQRLRADKLVCLVCDRDVTGGGLEVEFFGEKARVMGGPAALAVQTGTALMPVILWFEGDHWGAHVHEEIPVPAEGDSKQHAAAMQQVAYLFEAGLIRGTGTCCSASSSPTSTPPGWPPPRARPVPGAVKAGHDGQPCPGTVQGSPKGAISDTLHCPAFTPVVLSVLGLS
jgi:Bacterial lipid A biosynthesis acyltransferase